MKINQLFLLLLSFSFALFSCNSNTTKPKIGFLIRGYVIERCVKERDFFQERINQLGAEAVVADGQENDQLQIQQAQQMLKDGVDALVIFPVNLNTAAAIVRAANEKGVPVIAYESLIQNCNLDYYISADNKKGGVLMAQNIMKAVPDGNYVVIGGDKSDRNAVLIKEGNFEALNASLKQGNIKVVYDIYADWTSDEGYQEMKKVLNISGKKVDAVVSSNDGMATGIIKALHEAGLQGRIPVTGLDADLSACQRIADGTQLVTIYKSFKKQAYSAAEMAVKLAQGEKPETNAKVFNGAKEIPAYLIDPVAVDKNNLREVIVNGGVYSEKDVYRK